MCIMCSIDCVKITYKSKTIYDFYEKTLYVGEIILLIFN